MRKLIYVVLFAALILAGCASPATPAAEAPAALTQAIEPTQVPVEPTTALVEATMPPTEAPDTTAPAEQTTQQQAPSQTGAVVYKIVPGESSITYEVGETFFNDNRFNLAVGRTPQVSGDVSVDAGNPQNSQIGPLSIDISQFTSDSSRRDRAIRDRFLESGRFPIATFTSTSVSGLPDTYTPGQELTFQVIGDLTIRETTKPATFDVTAKVEGDTLMGTATTTILMSEWSVGPIQIAGMLGTEDEVKLTFVFVARQ